MMMAQNSDNNSSSPVVMGSERIPIGPGRAYWGLRCQHAERGATPMGHESVYRFYDATGDLLYVGTTWNIMSRWVKHRRKPWWPQVVRGDVTCYATTQRTARAIEARAILTEVPRHNIARPKMAAGA